MTSVNELFPKSRKLAYDAKQQLSQVQNGLKHASELFLSLDELNRQLDIMDTLVNRQTPAQREIWRQKILELREESQAIRRQGQYYDRMVNANVREQKEREELLTRRKRRSGEVGADAERGMEDLVETTDSLENSKSMVGELLNIGQAQLQSLKDQRRRMRGIKMTVLTIGNKIGLSNATLKAIEKRDVTDMYLVFGGMFVTLSVFYFVWFR